MNSPTVIDLFSGCGGMSWGLHKAGFKILAGIDNWQRALATFQLNHPTAITIEADLSLLDPFSVMQILGLKEGCLDCLIGGPPCQGFSKNVPAGNRFLQDSRNQLFRDFLRFVAAMLPKVIVMENVAEIYNAYEGTVRAEIIESLKLLGYKVEVAVLYAPDYGIPQRRRRCFFFASRMLNKPVLPSPFFGAEKTNSLFGLVKQYRSAWSAISDLPVLENGEGFEPMPYNQQPQNEYQETLRRDSNVLYDHITRKLNPKQFARIAALEPGQGLKNLPKELRPESGYSGAYGRLDFEMIAPTITRWVFHPGSGRFCHPREARLLTIREAARIQAFTDDFRFTGTYIEKAHQVGNAVPPLLMQSMATKIKICLQVLPTEVQPGRLPRVVGAQS